MEENLPNQTGTALLNNKRLVVAKVIAVLLQVSGVAACIYFLAYPVAAEVAYLYYLVYPLLCIAVYRVLSGYVVILSGSSDKRFGIYLAFIYPQALIVGQVWLRYDMLSYIPLILPTVLLAVAFVAAMMFKNEGFNFNKLGDKIGVVSLAVLGLFLGFGFSYLYNFSGNKDQPLTYHVTLADKYIVAKQGNSRPYKVYHLVVKPWQYSQLKNDFKVSKEFYENLDPNRLSVQVFIGKLNAPWYKVWGFYVKPGPS